MSMTADAWGHEAEVEGQKVFWVDDIELSGANILFSDCATYQKTRLIVAENVAENQDPGSRDPTALVPNLRSNIAASTDSLNFLDPTSTTQSEEKAMDELQKQLAALTATVTDAIGKLQAEVAAQGAKIEAMEADRRAEKEAIAAAKSQQAEEQRTAALIKSIVEEIRPTIQAAAAEAVNSGMSRFVNPSRQPQRITTPLLAGGAGQQQASVSAEALNLQLQIAQISGELKASHNMADQIRLLDEKRALEQQLLMMQPA